MADKKISVVRRHIEKLVNQIFTRNVVEVDHYVAAEYDIERVRKEKRVLKVERLKRNAFPDAFFDAICTVFQIVEIDGAPFFPGLP